MKNHPTIEDRYHVVIYLNGIRQKDDYLTRLQISLLESCGYTIYYIPQRPRVDQLSMFPHTEGNKKEHNNV